MPVKISGEAHNLSVSEGLKGEHGECISTLLSYFPDDGIL